MENEENRNDQIPAKVEEAQSSGSTGNEENRSAVWVFFWALLLGVLLGGSMATYFWKKKFQSGVVEPGERISYSLTTPQGQQDPYAKHMNEFFNDVFDEKFFQNSSDPSYDIELARQKFRKFFDEAHGEMNGQLFPSAEGFDAAFNRWVQQRLSHVQKQFIRREDAQYIYYELPIGEVEQNSLSVSIENGNLVISGKVKKIDGEEALGAKMNAVGPSLWTRVKNFFGGGKKSYVEFTKVVTIPQDVDEHMAKITTESDRVIVTFPKFSPDFWP